jgi:hypothetical protein
MVVVGYTLAWLPLNLFQLYMVRPSEEYHLPNIETVFFSVHWLAMAHTGYNPLIYAWLNMNFRSAFLQVNKILVYIFYRKRSIWNSVILHCANFVGYAGTANLSSVEKG